MEITDARLVDAEVSGIAPGRIDTDNHHHCCPGSDLLSTVSRGSESGLVRNASFYYIVPSQLIAEGKIGEWVSAKEQNGLRLHSIQFWRTGIDHDTIPYHKEIRLVQGGPILVLGFKER